MVTLNNATGFIFYDVGTIRLLLFHMKRLNGFQAAAGSLRIGQCFTAMRSCWSLNFAVVKTLLVKRENVCYTHDELMAFRLIAADRFVNWCLHTMSHRRCTGRQTPLTICLNSIVITGFFDLLSWSAGWVRRWLQVSRLWCQLCYDPITYAITNG